MSDIQELDVALSAAAEQAFDVCFDRDGYLQELAEVHPVMIVRRLALRCVSLERQLKEAEAEVAALHKELTIIATANPGKWDADMRDQFQDWAQSRARAAIDSAKGDK